MNFHGMGCRKRTQTAVSGQKNGASVGFSEDERKAVVNGQLRVSAHNLPRPKNTFAGQVHYLESATNECLLLSDCEFEKIVLKQSIRNENFMRQLQKNIEQ